MDSSFEVERKVTGHDKPVKYSAPPYLPGTMEFGDVKFSVETTHRRTFGDFSLNRFFARYMAGGRSLRESRNVSRKRLALASCGIGYMDAEPLTLLKDIERYNQAVDFFSQHHLLTKSDICSQHRLLAPNTPDPGVPRKIESWIGGGCIQNAQYVCPQPELIMPLLDNWLDFHNKTQPATIQSTIIGHARLVGIHPFLDGNGRLARAFLDGALKRILGDRIPLFTYRLSPQCDPRCYLEALKGLHANDIEGLKNPFWHQAFSWADKKHRQINEQLNVTSAWLSKQIGLSMLSPVSTRLLRHLWHQPVVCEKGLQKSFQVDWMTASNAIAELVRCKVLIPRRTKMLKGVLIYDCPPILDAFNAIDELLGK